MPTVTNPEVIVTTATCHPASLTTPSPHLTIPLLPLQDLVIPLAIDNALPDCLVRGEAWAERMRVQWQPGDRFRMFFGGKISSKTHKTVKTGG